MKKQVIGGNKTRAFLIVKMFFLIVLLLAYMVPFFLILINSFKRKATVIKEPLVLIDPKGITFENFINAFKQMNYPLAFLNSLIISVISVTFIIIFAAMAAYVFVRTKWAASKFFFALMIASMVVPFQVLMIPLVSIYGSSLGMLNSKSSLIFFYLGFGMNLAVFMYHGFIKSSVPISLEEAAKLDGCTKFQTFFLVVLPLLKSITSTMIVLDVLWIWNDFLLPSLVLGKKELYTLPLSTYSFYGTYSNDLGKIMAGLVMTVLPVIALYLFLQKHIISGIVSGAVKS
ncbi:MAG: carbohydrate transporter rane protein 2, family [Oscillospiraceae bacterium]|jgi:raffinose/stachyose/melibiose transport system permease protein|nr:carbohydrate transporter rane protein 2, family [Oscillospiraceae bacterium]